MVEDAFPGWYEVLKGDRVKPFISEEVKAANLRAELDEVIVGKILIKSRPLKELLLQRVILS